MDLWDTCGFAEDIEGADFVSEEAALSAAKEAATEIAADQLPNSVFEKVVVRLRDQDRKLIATVTLHLDVQRGAGAE